MKEKENIPPSTPTDTDNCVCLPRGSYMALPCVFLAELKVAPPSLLSWVFVVEAGE